MKADLPATAGETAEQHLASTFAPTPLLVHSRSRLAAWGKGNVGRVVATSNEGSQKNEWQPALFTNIRFFENPANHH
jgi:hypothetical protein